MPTPIASTTILARPYMQLQLICEGEEEFLLCRCIWFVRCRVYSQQLADTTGMVVAVADGAVHTYLRAGVVRPAGMAHRPGCNGIKQFKTMHTYLCFLFQIYLLKGPVWDGLRPAARGLLRAGICIICGAGQTICLLRARTVRAKIWQNMRGWL